MGEEWLNDFSSLFPFSFKLTWYEDGKFLVNPQKNTISIYIFVHVQVDRMIPPTKSFIKYKCDDSFTSYNYKHL